MGDLERFDDERRLRGKLHSSRFVSACMVVAFSAVLATGPLINMWALVSAGLIGVYVALHTALEVVVYHALEG